MLPIIVLVCIDMGKRPARRAIILLNNDEYRSKTRFFHVVRLTSFQQLT